ncbi:MAG: DUF4937 domain-containing protein [Planctomycetes bacterium]|nr:DUF4937 domain-containing protein [Planctomycetota bacterium]
MIVKLIQVDVIPDRAARFSAGQQAWQALIDVKGFRGQTGGWALENRSRAILVGLWRDRTCYEHFMTDVHDDVFAVSGQQGTYGTSEVSLWNRIFDVPGRFENMPSAIDDGLFIRVALCRLKPARREHFIDAQETIWNPGMASAGGLQAGVFCQSSVVSDHSMVCTLWGSEADHRHYREGPFHDLRRQADVEADCESVSGLLASVETSWRVPPRI